MPTRSLPAVTLAITSLTVLLLSACSFGVSASEPNLPPVAAVDPAETADRTDCNAILGTAFRSPAERDWFQQNCGKWPPVQVSDAPVVNVPAIAPEVQARCDAQRGKPYANNDARNWYLQNCNSLTPATTASNVTTTDGGSSGPDRTNCDEIRGTSYRSANEQRWYQQNCSGNQGGNEGRQANGQQQNGNQSANEQPAANSGTAANIPNPTVAACQNIASHGGPRNAAERELYLRFCR